MPQLARPASAVSGISTETASQNFYVASHGLIEQFCQIALREGLELQSLFQKSLEYIRLPDVSSWQCPLHSLTRCQLPFRAGLRFFLSYGGVTCSRWLECTQS